MAKSELVVNDEPLQPVAVQQSKYLSLIEMSIEKGADLVQIEKFMDLQERYEANEAKKQFNYAMSVFQSALPIIEKKGLVNYTSGKGTTNYNYARLEDIAQAIRPALKLSGLSYRFTQEQNAGQIKVTCIVTHIDGHSEESSLHSNPDLSGGKDPLKAMASAISYLRRYTLTGLLGIVVGGEDDEGGEGGFAHGDQQSDCYPDEYFNKHFPNWEKAILAKKKTPDQIIASGNNQGIIFSQDQLNKINKVGKA
jgi:hypothetical protein